MSDPLLRWRHEFPILEGCVYLVSHSLGAMPRRAAEYVQDYMEIWNRRGVRAWAEGWWDIGRTSGDRLAPILGVDRGTISMHQNVTTALGLVLSCYEFDGRRRKIVLSESEFPSTQYLVEGFRRYGAEVVYVPAASDTDPAVDRLLDAIDDETLLVPVSAVFFKSSAVLAAAAVVERAQQVGARVILDVYQAAGVLPLDLGTLGVDFAVGGSVKWLCGGPGAAYLYVRPDLAPQLEPALTGWAAHAAPFAFESGANHYADAPERFQTGTPNVPALEAACAGYEIVAEIGVGPIRQKSLRLTQRIIDHANRAGYRIGTPLDRDARGGTVTIDVPDAARVAEGLIHREIIIDHRPGAGIRMAPHFYNSEEDIDRAMAVLGELVDPGASTSR